MIGDTHLLRHSEVVLPRVRYDINNSYLESDTDLNDGCTLRQMAKDDKMKTRNQIGLCSLKVRSRTKGSKIIHKTVDSEVRYNYHN